jgi:hypothetical protein
MRSLRLLLLIRLIQTEKHVVTVEVEMIITLITQASRAAKRKPFNLFTNQGVRRARRCGLADQQGQGARCRLGRIAIGILNN